MKQQGRIYIEANALAYGPCLHLSYTVHTVNVTNTSSVTQAAGVVNWFIMQLLAEYIIT